MDIYALFVSRKKNKRFHLVVYVAAISISHVIIFPWRKRRKKAGCGY